MVLICFGIVLNSWVDPYRSCTVIYIVLLITNTSKTQLSRTISPTNKQNICILPSSICGMDKEDIEMIKAESALVGGKIEILEKCICFDGYFPMMLGETPSIKNIMLKNVGNFPDTLNELKNIEILHMVECKNFPEEHSNLPNLKKLHITRMSVPWHLDKFPNVEIFEVAEIKLDDFPGMVRDMGKLKELSITDSQLRTFPNIRGLKKLLKLTFFGSTLELPWWIGELESLRAINLSFARLPEIPSTICKLKNLEILDLRLATIGRIPDVFYTMPNLQIFSYHTEPASLRNKLISNPTEFIIHKRLAESSYK